jgi:hypothetical protein
MATVSNIIVLCRYSWIAYNWIYRPATEFPIATLWSWYQSTPKPRKATVICDDQILKHEIASLKFDITMIRDNYFDHQAPAPKKPVRLARRHSI